MIDRRAVRCLDQQSVRFPDRIYAQEACFAGCDAGAGAIVLDPQGKSPGDASMSTAIRLRSC